MVILNYITQLKQANETLNGRLTLYILNEWMICYVNYISIKLLFRK